MNGEQQKKPKRERNIAMRTSPEVRRRIVEEADRQAERRGLSGSELRARKFFMVRVLLEYLDQPESERDRRYDRGFELWQSVINVAESPDIPRAIRVLPRKESTVGESDLDRDNRTPTPAGDPFRRPRKPRG